MSRRPFLLCGLGLCGAYARPTLAAGPLPASSFPNRPIHFVIPFPPGGVTDISARLLAASLAQTLGQPVIPENRPGAGGNLAAQYVARAVPDGHTLLFATSGSHGINPSLYPNLPFDPVRDFTPIAYTSSSPNLFTARRSFPGSSMADFIEIARRRATALTVGLGSLGTTQHMAVELLRHEMRLSFTTVPYRGGALALQDLIGGTIDVLCDGFPSSIPHVRQGSIKALGVTSIERVPGAPDIPSVAETIPGFSSTGWFGVAGPAGLPAAIVERLNRAVNEALTDPALRRKHDEIGARIHGGTPRQFAEHIRREVARWHEVVKATGARAA